MTPKVPRDNRLTPVQSELTVSRAGITERGVKCNGTVSKGVFDDTFGHTHTLSGVLDVVVMFHTILVKIGKRYTPE